MRNSSTHDWAAGKQDLPGGIIETNESPSEAVIREVKEEAGITLKSKDITLGYSSTSMYLGTNYVLFLYSAHIADDTVITLNFEHDGYCWYDVDEALRQYEHPAYQAGLKYLADNNLL